MALTRTRINPRSMRLLESVAIAPLVLAAACARAPQGHEQAPPEVAVVRAHAQSLPLTRDLVGRLSALRTADVRARVAGILQRRLYREGSEVGEGQALFQIDPAPLKAALDAALAALAQAQANSTNAHVVAQRNRDLVPGGLVSRADLDTSEASERSTSALVKQAEANVESARINLGYATVTAPISGRSGQQRVTEGALVGQGEATLLTTIEQIDHLYVNFDRPAEEILRLRQAQASGDVTLYEREKAQLEVLLPDGRPYHETGAVDFADVSVDPSNGALAFRGIIANPDRQLLPGMFVNVRLTLGQHNHSFLVSQGAVRRDSGGAFVQVIGTDGKVSQRRVQADAMRGTDWIVTSGLADGDEVIVSGVDKVRPGMPARAVPQAAAAETAPAGAVAREQH
jgi:membrane fusion protein, multidrug efflux system